MLRRSALFLLVFLASGATAAADPWSAETLSTADALRTRALADDRAGPIVESIGRDVGPRLAGSDGDRKAVAWALEMLKAQGFANVHAEPVDVPRWVRGALSARIVGDDRDLVAVALGGSAGTPTGGIDAPVVMTHDIDSLRALPPEAIAGRIVYFDQRTERTRDSAGYRKAVRVRVYAATEAARRGALAVAIRSIGTSTGPVAHTGAQRHDVIVRRIPAIALSNDDADRLAARLNDGSAVRMHLVVGAHDAGKASSANVVGEIPGATGEVVLLAAHLDSWDLATGSNDDGAGVAIVTAAAALVKAVAGTPRRTLRVVLYADEETYAVGGKQYALANAAGMDQIVLAMEADFGSAPVWRLNADVPDDRWPVIEAMAQALGPLGVAIGANHEEAGADIGWQRARGVPLLSPLQDGTHYFDTHHSSADTLDNVDREGLRQNVAVYAMAAWLASEHDPGFGRMPVAPQ